MRQVTECVRTIDLGRHQTLSLDSDRDDRVRVLSGATWLTEEGTPEDAFLSAGGEVRLNGGRALIEGWTTARVEVIVRGGRRRSRLATGWRRAMQGLQRQVVRLQLGPTSAPGPRDAQK